MGVYIKDMDMPKSCYECWALDDDYDYPMCRITQEQRGYNFNTREQKMGRCPLTDVLECKNCKHRDDKCGMGEHRWCEILKMSTVPNDFCSYGKKREESEVEE